MREPYRQAEQLAINVTATRRAIRIFLVIVVVPSVTAALMFRVFVASPRLTINSVQLVLMGNERHLVMRRDVVAVMLVNQLPEIVARQSERHRRGLHGEFDLPELGRAVLDAAIDAPPFVVVHTRDTALIFNHARSTRTTEMYRAIVREWPEVVSRDDGR